MKNRSPESTPHPYILWSLVLVAVASVSLASILIRLADAPPLAIAFYRVALASVAMAPVSALRHQRKHADWTPALVTQTLLSGLFLALHFLFWITSLTMTSVASSVTLVSTTPLFAAAFSCLWLQEPLHKRLGLGILLTTVGSGLVAGTDFSFSRTALTGDLLAILGALMAAGYFIAGRYARRSLDLATYAFGSYGTAALVLLVCSYLSSADLTGFSMRTYSALVLLALVPQLIGHTTFNWTLRFLSPTTVAILVLGEPIGASLLAYLVFGETVSGLKALGLLVLGAGIGLSSLARPEAKSHIT